MQTNQAINVLTFRRNFLGTKDEEERFELMVGFITQGQTTEIAEKILESENSLKADIQAGNSHLEAKIDAVEARLEAKIDAVEAKLEAKIDAVEAKLEAVEAKLEAVEAKLEAKIDAVDTKIDFVEKNLRTEMTANKQELLAAISASTNKTLIWSISSFIGIAGLAVAFLRLK
jgi:vacuolar-type H+-ATPase subunit I/STV1